MQRDLNQVPQWAQYLLGSEDVLRDFNEWVEERKVFYAVQAMETAADFASVKGVRFLLGELDAIRNMVNWIPNQAALEAANKENYKEYNDERMA